MANLKETITSLRNLIDNDNGLKAKRKLLTIVSITLLAFTITDAKIIEINTFFVKLELGREHGIPTLLALSVTFLLLRYYNYAKPHQDQLFNLWSARMMSDNDFLHTCPFSDDMSGIEIDLAPSHYLEYIDPMYHLSERGHADTSYICGIGKRFIKYEWGDNNEQLEIIQIKGKHLRRTFLLEVKYQAGSFFKHRENLDIYGPYLIGILAIISLLY